MVPLAILVVIAIAVDLLLFVSLYGVFINLAGRIRQHESKSSKLFKSTGEGLKLVSEQGGDLQLQITELKSIVDVQAEEINDLKSDVLGLQNASANSTRPLELAPVVPATPARRNSTTRRKVGQ